VAALKKQVQFLPGDELSKTPTGRTVKWGLKFARHLIVFTQLILIVAFVSRFRLDQNLTDLKQQIQENQAVIGSFEELENNARFLHKRIEAIEKINKETQKQHLILEEFTKIIPVEVTFDELDIKENQVSIKGKSLSTLGLITLLNQLQENKNFTEVELESATSPGSQDPSLDFRINVKIANLKTQENEN